MPSEGAAVHRRQLLAHEVLDAWRSQPAASLTSPAASPSGRPRPRARGRRAAARRARGSCSAATRGPRPRTGRSSRAASAPAPAARRRRSTTARPLRQRRPARRRRGSRSRSVARVRSVERPPRPCETDVVCWSNSPIELREVGEELDLGDAAAVDLDVRGRPQLAHARRGPRPRRPATTTAGSSAGRCRASRSGCRGWAARGQRQTLAASSRTATIGTGSRPPGERLRVAPRRPR